ncbi:MAG: hypothetical protein MHPSP_002345, partial [Paramarteilia canceri]
MQILENGILPIIVFDGETPLVKQKTLKARKEQQSKHEMDMELKKKIAVLEKARNNLLKSLKENKIPSYLLKDNKSTIINCTENQKNPTSDDYKQYSQNEEHVKRIDNILATELNIENICNEHVSLDVQVKFLYYLKAQIIYKSHQEVENDSYDPKLSDSHVKRSLELSKITRKIIEIEKKIALEYTNDLEFKLGQESNIQVASYKLSSKDSYYGIILKKPKIENQSDLKDEIQYNSDDANNDDNESSDKISQYDTNAEASFKNKKIQYINDLESESEQDELSSLSSSSEKIHHETESKQELGIRHKEIDIASET